MDVNVRDQMTRGRSIGAFKSTHTALFAAGKAKTLSEEVAAAIDGLTDLGADQISASGGSLAGTAGVNSLVDAVYEDMVALAGTARTIEKNSFDLPFEFLMPRSRANDVLIATGEAFYTEASKTGIAAQFTEWGLPTDFLADLRADLDAYEGKVQGRDTLTQERKDAVAAIDELEERLVRAIGGLNTLMENTLRGDKNLLAQWKEAAKLVRTKAHHASPTPPPARG